MLEGRDVDGKLDGIVAPVKGLIILILEVRPLPRPRMTKNVDGIVVLEGRDVDGKLDGIAVPIEGLIILIPGDLPRPGDLTRPGLARNEGGKLGNEGS